MPTSLTVFEGGLEGRLRAVSGLSVAEGRNGFSRPRQMRSRKAVVIQAIGLASGIGRMPDEAAPSRKVGAPLASREENT